MEVNKGYKQTEIGVIPEDWEVKSISDLTDIVTGGTPSTEEKEYWNGDIRWMSSGELNLKHVHEVIGRITAKGLNNSSTKIIPPCSVLIGLAGQGKTRATAAYNYIELCTNQSIAAILPNDNFDSLYLYYYLDRQYDYLRLLSSGDGGRGGLNKNILMNFKIAIPSEKKEQNSIAEYLSDIDALIESCEKIITKKKSIKSTLQEELLSGKTRLRGFTDKWSEIVIGEHGATYTGLSGKTKNDFQNGNTPYIPFLNVILNETIDLNYLDNVTISANENQNKVLKGDLIFNTSSETPEEVGMCSALISGIDELYLNSFCFGFRPDTDKIIDSLFLAYYFRSSIGRAIMSVLAQGATRYNLSKQNFLQTKITIPSIEEQKEIANLLSDLDTELKNLEAKKSKYFSLKSAMMEQLLTGQIRLKQTT